MSYDPDRHHRRSIRLRGYDYATLGAYFVTLCAQDRACLFGGVAGDAVNLTPAGQMVEEHWQDLPAKFPGVGLDACVIMPNHFHGIVILAATDQPPQADRTSDQGGHIGPPLRRESLDVGADLRVRPAGASGMPGSDPPAMENQPITLPRIMQWFKTMTTNAYFRGVKEAGWPPCRGRLWQRNYYERIIRNDRELDALRAYIVANPARWADDPEHV